MFLLHSAFGAWLNIKKKHLFLSILREYQYNENSLKLVK